MPLVAVGKYGVRVIALFGGRGLERMLWSLRSGVVSVCFFFVSSYRGFMSCSNAGLA